MSGFQASLKKWINNPWVKAISIVGLIAGFGGVVLTLVLGIQAWAQTESARKYRLCAGALVAGVLLGVFFYTVYPGLLLSVVDPSAKAWVAFLGVPILLLAFTFFLESLRRKLG